MTNATTIMRATRQGALPGPGSFASVPRERPDQSGHCQDLLSEAGLAEGIAAITIEPDSTGLGSNRRGHVNSTWTGGSTKDFGDLSTEHDPSSKAVGLDPQGSVHVLHEPGMAVPVRRQLCVGSS